MQGHDIEKEKASAVNKRVEEVQRRAQLKLVGSEEELEKMEWADLGFGYETA